MKFGLVAATAMLLAATASAAPPQAAAVRPAAALPHVQALYEGWVRSDQLPGIVGAFGAGDGPTTFVAAGRIAAAPGAPVAGPGTLWRVYSMTKPVTALAAMILIDQGRLGLDDPVANYIPAFARMRVLTDPAHSLASRPATRPITIRMLLTHTAGLGYTIVNQGPIVVAYERAGIVPFQTDAATEARMRPTRPTSLAEFANRVARQPLIAEPGTRWSYSIGLDVMGAVIERASGEPFDGFVQRHILSPLRLSSSYWQVPAADARRLATTYAYVGDQPVPMDPSGTSVFLRRPSFAYGGAGLVMSARDYDRFLHCLQDGGTLDGATLIRPATAALMMSNLLPSGVTFTAAAAGGTGPGATVPIGYGAGGYVLTADGPGGAAKGTYGWSGAAGTQAWVNPIRRTRATIMVNYFPGERLPLREQTARALAADEAR